MIPLFKVHMPKDLTKLNETLKSGFVAEGPMVKEFEEKISRWTDNKNIIAVNSGTSALHLSLVLCGIKPGDIVISTPITSPATNVSVVNIGAKLVWADVDENTSNISPESIGRLINKYGDKVKAVIAVDWGGYPCDYDKIKSVIPDTTKLIQDAAHSLGSLYKGQLTGSLVADFTTFSFQAIKHITTGDGGMITCKNKEDLERGRRLRWFGIDRNKPGRTWNDDLPEIGYKFHMNDIAASIGIHQLDELDATLNRRRSIARAYIDNIKGLRYQFSSDYDADSSYWLFTIYVNGLDNFMTYMKDKEITAFPVHIRNDYYTGFKNVVLDSDRLTGVENISGSMCCIPVGEWLSDNEVEHIILAMQNWYKLKKN
jgi:dTDP-4-amino-4,6-dideoxygalactose transaminase